MKEKTNFITSLPYGHCNHVLTPNPQQNILKCLGFLSVEHAVIVSFLFNTVTTKLNCEKPGQLEGSLAVLFRGGRFFVVV